MTMAERRGGFALAITLVFMLVLTGGVLATISKVSTERSVLDDSDAGLEAHVRAEAGLDAALRSWDGAGGPPPSGTTVEIPLTDGSAEVVAHELRAEAGNEPALYAIRSRAVYTGPGRAGAPDAVRTVGQLAIWVTGDMDLNGGWVGLNGLDKRGTSGKISGNDLCGKEDAIPGAYVPRDPGYTQSGGDPEDVLEGDPPLDTLAHTAEEAAQAVDIDWEGIVNGDVLEPDYTVPPDAWPTIGDGEWPIIYIDNPGEVYELQSEDAGQGTLIVRGGFKAEGDHMWNGVLLVGGQLILRGDATVQGAVVSGLNVKLGEDPSMSVADQPDEAMGGITVQFDSCDVENAMQRFSGFQVLDNTWTDSWANAPQPLPPL